MTWHIKLALLVPLMAAFLVLGQFVFRAEGKELGRLPFAGPGIATSTVPLTAGEVTFWTDLDIRYEGAPSLVYHVDLSQGGSRVASASCEPLGSLDTKLGWLTTYDGVTHLERGLGRMACSLTLPTSAPTHIEATLLIDAHGSVLTLKKADLAIRQ